ncbi:MAG: sulfite exporter TauE/SafE family protein [Proteobacteria bacterium]|nr:sulfite exporter TauE/SafE family protein [Pseudomonadota bacterium]
MPNDFTLIFSLLTLGFFGGFTHCIGMCGPFVITQNSNRLQQIPLEKFYGIERLKNLALLPYQSGRITTYSLIGFFSSLLSENIREEFGFKIVSIILLLLASLFFFNLAFEGKLKLSFKSPILEGVRFFPRKILSLLFLNPRGFRGYFLGIILGFIPCGLLYGAFLISAAIFNPFLAAFGMFVFGLATFPSLFLTACGGNILQRIPEFKIVAKALILLNAIMLLLMAIKLIN